MAAVDYFLKLDGIDGESADDKYKNYIDLQSWSWGESNAGAGHAQGGSGAGKVVMQDFHFVMNVNKASPKLLEACAIGSHIKLGTLTCRKAGGKQVEFLKIKLTDVLVSSYQTGGSGHSDIIPVDQVSLNFSKIEYEYYIQKPDGSAVLGGKSGYDVRANKKV